MSTATSTTYRLREELGGREVKLVNGETGHWSESWVELVEVPGLRVCVSNRDLTEVKPPLPPEPPMHAVRLDGRGIAWQRVANCAPTWQSTEGDESCWPDMHERGFGPLTELVPPPLPVKLPWSDSSEVGDHVTIEPADNPYMVAIHISESPDETCTGYVRTADLLRVAWTADQQAKS